MRGGPSRRALAAALTLALGLALPAVPGARAAPGDEAAAKPADDAAAEPPPEAAAGEDYAIALDDSLADDTIEVGVGASGRPGIAPRRTRRIRFRGEGLHADVREGKGDPLAGGAIEGRIARGTLHAGRLAPRWGRGIVLGAPAEPWDVRADDRGAGTGRAGDGISFRRGERAGVETLAGTFERRRLGGARLFSGPWKAGGITDGRRHAQSSLGFAGGADEIEFAMDERGRFRVDALRVRETAGGKLEAHARAGAAGFRSLAEPRRSGPAQAVTLRFLPARAALATQAIASWWRFRPGLAGARAALQTGADLPSGHVVLGLEEQHGPRRASGSFRAARGMRQGAWGEWTARGPALTVSFREEVWGAQRFRRAVRRVSGVRAEVLAPGGVRVRAAHTAFRVAFGENLYLREAYSDRLVLRALTGRGTRTQLEVRFPAGGGRLTLSLQLTHTRAGPPRMVWSLDWARTARTGR